MSGGDGTVAAAGWVVCEDADCPTMPEFPAHAHRTPAEGATGGQVVTIRHQSPGGRWLTYTGEAVAAALSTAAPAQGDRLTDDERETLREAFHVRNEWEYGECDHGAYSGGPSHGEPYAMCERWAKPDTILTTAVEQIAAARQSRPEHVVAAEVMRDAADALPSLTEGPLRVGTALWPECDRDAYSLAIEEAQAALRAQAARLAEPTTDGA